MSEPKQPMSHCPRWVSTHRAAYPMAHKNIAHSLEELARRMRALGGLMSDRDADIQITDEDAVGIGSLLVDYADQLDDYSGAIFDHCAMQKKAPKKSARIVEINSGQTA